MPSQRFLKFLVIGLGVAIVFALGLVVYGVARLNTVQPKPAATVPAEASPNAFVAAVGDMDLGQPIGSEITQMVALGGGQVAISLRGGTWPDRIILVDLGAGKVLGTTYVSPAPKP